MVSPRWYCNILSLNNIKKKHKVTYNSSAKTIFIIHKADGTNHVFKPSKKGLLFSDVKSDTAHVLLNTVDSIKTKYAVKQYTFACKARLIQNNIGHIMKANTLHADHIFRINLGLL